MLFFKKLFRYIIKGVIYAVAFGLIGAAFAFIKKWPFLKGAYLFVIAGGVLTMFVSIFLLIGTPNMRKAIYFHHEKENNLNRGAEGIGPALMGIVMVMIGFWLEALMH